MKSIFTLISVLIVIAPTASYGETVKLICIKETGDSSIPESMTIDIDTLEKKILTTSVDGLVPSGGYNSKVYFNHKYEIEKYTENEIYFSIKKPDPYYVDNMIVKNRKKNKSIGWVSDENYFSQFYFRLDRYTGKFTVRKRKTHVSTPMNWLAKNDIWLPENWPSWIKQYVKDDSTSGSCSIRAKRKF
ncbi:MAG: hypothetical protein JAY68_14665 [Candidatus Thiodiazotropha taylori]|nr:hypothetical protein [Candidatus Thiodiazotropha taylori]